MRSEPRVWCVANIKSGDQWRCYMLGTMQIWDFVFDTHWLVFNEAVTRRPWGRGGGGKEVSKEVG